MKIIADLHIHSKYSRAVSQQMIIPEIAKWADKKGIDIVGTGDFTHPLWFRELKSNLEEENGGIFKVKNSPETKAKFLLTAEISSIYSQGGKGRRIHTLVLAPSFETVEKINAELVKRGANLLSDGRPIIGMSARDLTELVLSVDKNCLIVPAHCWTPWFSLYGSMSGFDSIEECYQDMSKYIYAIETGLSSNPSMNWRIKELDNKSILSFSDAHSGAKLGREATVFEINDKTIWGYDDIRESISEQKIAYTIEFYPEEGKYHYTGHRNCQVRQSPEETKKLGTTCPVCGKPLTVGVMHRVEQLSNVAIEQGSNIDNQGVNWISYNGRAPYVMLVPLMEIIAEAVSSSTTSQKVINAYDNLTNNLGSELEILLKIPILEIEKTAGEKVAEGVKKVRSGEITILPGYDGEFGVVKIWGEEKGKEEGKGRVDEQKQMSLF